MSSDKRRMLQSRFDEAQDFLSTRGQKIINEMVAAFQPLLWEKLEELSILNTEFHMAIPSKPDFSKILTEQLSHAWSLGFAAGASGFSPQESKK